MHLRQQPFIIVVPALCEVLVVFLEAEVGQYSAEAFEVLHCALLCETALAALEDVLLGVLDVLDKAPEPFGFLTLTEPSLPLQDTQQPSPMSRLLYSDLLQQRSV